MQADVLTEKRLRELAERAYSTSRYIYTDFMDLAGQSIFHSLEQELRYSGTEIFGGADGCERCVIRFGNEEMCGYVEDFPIVILKVAPVMKKFAEELTHRDFLGSLMGLGIEREKIGDIIVKEKEAYVFAKEEISGYIAENLDYVKHTHVKTGICETLPDEAKPCFKEVRLIVSSNRLDAVISGLYKLSRDASLNLIRSGKVYINGIETTSNAKRLNSRDVISVRGYGKFIFDDEGGKTKKDRLYVDLRVYI